MKRKPAILRRLSDIRRHRKSARRPDI